MPPPPGFPPQQAYASASAFAGFWIRVVAYVIDFIILAVVEGILDAIFHTSPNARPDTGYSIVQVLNLLISIAYFAGLWTLWGATLGQRIFKLRVVDANTLQPIGFGKALLRWLGLVVSFLVCFIGVIWVAFDSRKQGWMDKIAGTLVLQG